MTLTTSYWLAETECTQALWEAVMGSNPSSFTGDQRRPVEQVSWEDCQGFLRKLNGRLNGRVNGLQARLPTEAEWEYACRAGSTGAYAGDLNAMGWYRAKVNKRTHPVGQKRANAWGLYDMHGNAWEWCADWNGDYPSGSISDPTGPASGSMRVNRGGCWRCSAWYCRSANRNWGSPGYRRSILGFRIALSSP